MEFGGSTRSKRKKGLAEKSYDTGKKTEFRESGIVHHKKERTYPKN